MSIRFLTPDDYSFQLREDVAFLISNDDDQRLPNAERAAAKIMKSYLADRYDIATIFYPMLEYSDALTFNTDSLCYYRANEQESYQVYQALENNTEVLPTNAENWQVFDKRDEMVMMYLADITIYHYYAADSVRTYTATIQERWKAAMQWLKGVSQGMLKADLPQLEKEEIKSDFRFGSDEAESYRY